MIRTPEQQYLHELIESYIAPLRSEIKELRQQLNTKPVKNNGALPVVNHWRSIAKRMPPEGENVTILWDDDTETDCVWTNVDMLAEVKPLYWRYSACG